MVLWLLVILSLGTMNVMKVGIVPYDNCMKTTSSSYLWVEQRVQFWFQFWQSVRSNDIIENVASVGCLSNVDHWSHVKVNEGQCRRKCIIRLHIIWMREREGSFITSAINEVRFHSHLWEGGRAIPTWNHDSWFYQEWRMHVISLVLNSNNVFGVVKVL